MYYGLNPGHFDWDFFTILNPVEKKIKVIAWYEILGGFFGLLLFLYYTWVVISNPNIAIDQLGFEVYFFFFLFVGLFIFSIVAGRMLLKTDSLKKGIRLSIIIQFFQILSFTILGFTWNFHAGPNLSVGVDLMFVDDVTFKFQGALLDSSFEFSNNQREIILMINVLPLIIIGLLINYQNTLKE